MAEGGKMSALLGNKLQKNQDDGFKTVDTDSSEGLGEKEYVGLYFSAQWCPPCRAFKPVLIEFYNKMKQAGANKFEIIFVSSDKDDAAFKAYAKEMPWPALPYEERDKKNALSKKCKVQGIPTLVILDGKTGEIITDQGRQGVSSDPQGDMFPWTPKSILDIFNGEDVPPAMKETFEKGDILEKLKGKDLIGLYFSAHWCPPCRGFTPQLAEKYKELQKAGKKLEIVFMSRDKSQGEYDDYLKEMPWIALPYNDPRCDSLAKKFKINGIPALVLLTPDWKVITTDGRSAIMEDGIEDFPYNMKEVNTVGQRYVDQIQSSQCLIYFTDTQEDAECCKAAMRNTAKEYYKDGDDQELYFFVDNYCDEGIGKGLSEFVQGKEGRRCLMITDLDEMKVYKHKADDGWTVSEDSIREFVTKFKDNKIEASDIKNE